ncbi:MAG: YabP/YqfC family sporulation protein [Hominenteromicrobium sp.]
MGTMADKIRFGLTGGTIRTEVLGSSRMILEGCDGIIEYGPEQVGLRCGRQQVWVTGQNLQFVCVEEDSTVLAGRIEAIAFK